MKVRCIKDYYDIEKKEAIAKGAEFEVSDERGKALTTTDNKAGYPVCEVVATAPKKETGQRPKKKEA